jgi:hypothetical protein
MGLLWRIFGNDEDPKPLPFVLDKWPVKFYWFVMRNPLHNFTWHMIGVNGKDWERIGIDPLHSYARAGGWQWCVIKYKWLKLPYFSYINRWFRFRWGWGDAGNFTFGSFRGTKPEHITW